MALKQAIRTRKKNPETNEPVPRQPSNTASLFRVLWLAGGSLVYGQRNDTGIKQEPNNNPENMDGFIIWALVSCVVVFVILCLSRYMIVVLGA